MRSSPGARVRASGSMALLSCSVVALTLVVAGPAAGEVIDRVLGVVNGSVVTLSDVEGARRFGLVAAHSTDLRSALDRVIDRRLALVEVERYAPPEPSVARVDESIAAVRARFPSESAYAAALAETGMTIDQLRRHLRDDLRLQTYAQQRFGFAVQPSEDETLAYFAANQDRFKRGNQLPAYEDVRSEVREALIAEKKAESIREWIGGLRRRADITIVPQ